jgi:NAD(P)-dependent dehydrogenase (short-subunit alcohol dehydrogenase family)
MTTLQRTAIVVGVGSGQGLGAALARRFAVGGHRVIVSGRTEAKITQVVRDIVDRGGKAEASRADATVESDVVALFDFAQSSGHVIDFVVFNAGNNVRHDFRTMPTELFEQSWRVATFGGFFGGAGGGPTVGAVRQRYRHLYRRHGEPARQAAVHGIRIRQGRASLIGAIDGAGIRAARDSRRPCGHRRRHRW